MRNKYYKALEILDDANYLRIKKSGCEKNSETFYYLTDRIGELLDEVEALGFSVKISDDQYIIGD